ncbi:heterogeneous nuclear ribonucleoprotein D-like-A [Amphiura filiformis]|uniref:heterogeneous nuclear ribonucleoprotein D-like-A n=1 Tax=Amphiura filiformis TaxID=82378 RepID=UPI003B2140A2
MAVWSIATLKWTNLRWRSKCYGFVTFTDDQVVDQVLNEGDHSIDGKTVDAKRATKQKSYDPPKPKKVFVGGVPNDISEEEMKAHFQQFGEIQEVVFPVDPESRKRRGFAFVEFVGDDAVDMACGNQIKPLVVRK